MTIRPKAPLAVLDAEAWLKRYNLDAFKGIGLYLVSLCLSFGIFPMFGLEPFVPTAAGTVFTVVLMGWLMIRANKNAVRIRNAKIMIQTYDKKSTALQNAHKIISPEYGDLEIDDERWPEVHGILERVRELSKDDLEIQIVIDDIAEYLIGQFRDVGSLSKSVETERAMSTNSEDSQARLRTLDGAQQSASAHIDRMLIVLRAGHVELTMRDTSDGGELSALLLDLFHRLQADNETTLSSSVEERPLPRESLVESDGASAGPSLTKEAT